MTQSAKHPSKPPSAEALAEWTNEGGALATGPQNETVDSGIDPAPAQSSTAELTQLRVRVIALENIMISLLSEAQDTQLELIRTMSGHIAPRPGSTPHPVTTRAATQMLHLVDRATHFQSTAPA
jgi:hypothetical protein